MPLIAPHDRRRATPAARARAASTASTARRAKQARRSTSRPANTAPRSQADLPELAGRARPARAAGRAGPARRTTPGRVLGRTLAYAAGAGAGGGRRHRRRSMRRCGSATTGSWGPFELIDRLGADWFAERLARRGRRRCRRCCWRRRPTVLPGARTAGGKFLALDGAYRDVVRARRRAAAGGCQARRQAGAQERLGRRCGTSATASRASSSPRKMNALDAGDHASCSSRRSPLVAEQLQGAGDLQRGPASSPSAPISALALFAANIAAWGEIEKLVDGGQQRLQGAEICAVPGGRGAVRAWRSAAAARSCCTADAVQAHAETYIGLVECGVGLVPGWGGCRRDARALARRRAAAAGRCRRRPRCSRR